MKNKTELQKIFFTAIEENNIDKVKKLIQEGIDVNEKNISDFTPLFAAENIEIAKILIENGADVNLKGRSGMIPLTLFCEFSNEELVEFHIKNKADVNSKDNNNITPLMVTTNKNIALMLIQNEADINARNYCGETTLMMTVYDNNFDMVKLLLENNVDLTIKDDNGDDVFSYITSDEMKNLLLSYK